MEQRVLCYAADHFMLWIHAIVVLVDSRKLWLLLLTDSLKDEFYV
jgi:hypothetical protein